MSTHRSSRKPFRVLRFFIILILLLSATGLFLIWSNTSLQICPFTASFSNLPDGFDGCRIVVISDPHGTYFGNENERLISSITAQDPEAIFLIGDIIDAYRENPNHYTSLLGEQLSSIAPTYYVTGNHEWGSGSGKTIKQELRDSGVTVLGNSYVELQRNGDSILLAGLDDPLGPKDQLTPEDVAEKVLDADPDFWILLAHRNHLFVPRYSHLGADFVISGHAHGGLIRLPFTDGLISIDRTLFPKYTSGFYEENGSLLFVSRGLGNSGKTFRLFNRPEIAVLTLEKGT